MLVYYYIQICDNIFFYYFLFVFSYVLFLCAEIKYFSFLLFFLYVFSYFVSFFLCGRKRKCVIDFRVDY